jgi:hypothetical protein
VRKRWGLDARLGTFAGHVNVVGTFARHVNVIGSFACHVDAAGSPAFRDADTDADALGGTAACSGDAVNDGGAYVVPGRVVLPAHK